MAQQLTEGIIEDLLIYFKAGAPTKIQALNAEYADAAAGIMKAPDNEAYFVGEKTIRDGRNFPEVYIYGDEVTVERYNATFTDATHQLTVEIAAQASATDLLRRLMYRYARVYWEMIVARFFAATADDYGTTGEQKWSYEPPEALGTAGLYVGKVIITLTVNKQEDV